MSLTRRQLLVAGCGALPMRAQPPASCPTFNLPELQQRTFVVPKVDESGTIVSSEEASAWSFAEDFGEGVTLEMTVIPGGTFDMGSNERPDEQPVHAVTVSPFLMGTFEVTRGQWRQVSTFPKVRDELGQLVRRPNMTEEVENTLPIDIVYFHRAEEFCQRLRQRTGRPYRLPSEAEWEYACRAGTTTAYNFGDNVSLEVANYNALQRPLGLVPVGSKAAPNAFGLYDMHGNVMEWCLDWTHPNYQGAPADGSPWVQSGDSSKRVVRGGMYLGNPGIARSAARFYWLLDWSLSSIGFRVVLGPCTEMILQESIRASARK